jgi:hypothetical protein
MTRTMTREETAAYARTQIMAAGRILAQHTDRAGMCSCGRPRPCPIKQTCDERLRHFHTTLALVEMTQTLPLVTVA